MVDDKIATNVAFITLACAQLFHVINMASSQLKLLLNEITKNKFIWLAILICTSLILMVFAVPQTRMVLALNMLGKYMWMLSITANLIP